MKRLPVAGLILLGIVACNRDSGTKEAVDYTVKGDVVTIADDSPILRKLVCQDVVTGPYSYELVTSGTVKAIPNNYALVAAPFAGRITRSFIRLGQYVEKDAPVFEISSPLYYETGKAYYQAREQMNLDLKNLERQKDLLGRGVGVQKEYEEAVMNYALSKKDYENAIASLSVYQVDTADLVLGQPLIVRSPIRGTIVENNIVIGQYVREDSEPVATVAELSRVWVAGQVKEKDIRYVRDAAEVDIRLIAFPELNIKGLVYHINSIIDEDTRSVQVLIECDNKDHVMKPGMYVNATFTYLIPDIVAIPSRAIFQAEEASYVFVCTGRNQYTRRRVEVQATGKASVIVKSGLSSGERIIADGGFYLLGEN